MTSWARTRGREGPHHSAHPCKIKKQSCPHGEGWGSPSHTAPSLGGFCPSTGGSIKPTVTMTADKGWDDWGSSVVSRTGLCPVPLGTSHPEAAVSTYFPMPFQAQRQCHLLQEASMITPDTHLLTLSVQWLLAHVPSRACSCNIRAACIQGSTGMRREISSNLSC